MKNILFAYNLNLSQEFSSPVASNLELSDYKPTIYAIIARFMIRFRLHKLLYCLRVCYDINSS